GYAAAGSRPDALGPDRRGDLFAARRHVAASSGPDLGRVAARPRRPGVATPGAVNVRYPGQPGDALAFRTRILTRKYRYGVSHRCRGPCAAGKGSCAAGRAKARPNGGRP